MSPPMSPPPPPPAAASAAAAGAWSELLTHAEELTALYRELPPLERAPLRSVSLNGAGLTLRLELPRFPDLAPAAWVEAGCDRFEFQLQFLGMDEGLRMRGVPDGTEVDIDLKRHARDWEPRITVEVRGARVSLDFTAYAGLLVSHLSAYRSADGDPYAARRWFASRLDQHLHQVIPPTTVSPFYGR